MFEESKFIETHVDSAFVEDPHNDFFAIHGRQGGNPEIVIFSGDGHRNSVILWDPLFSDVHVGDNFEPAGQWHVHFFGKLHTVRKHAVNSIAHSDAFFLRFYVDVGSFVDNGLRNDEVREPDDWCLIGFIGCVFIV